MRQSRRGFTLIEVLVVIGIIMLLVALLAYGFRSMNRTAAGHETKADLKVCKAMLTEYEARNSLAGIEEMATVQTADPGAPPNTLKMFPVYCDPASQINSTNNTLTTPGALGTYWPSLALTDISVGTNTDMSDHTGNNQSPRYGNAVKSTLDVMYVLMRIPANQTNLLAVQSKRQLEPIPAATTTPNTTQQGNVLLDGWGNPIIFVPRGGMHVNITDPTTNTKTAYVVRSTGTLPVTGASDPPLTGAERPFFASAGQDGDFTQGEDNVYSFQE